MLSYPKWNNICLSNFFAIFYVFTMIYLFLPYVLRFLPFLRLLDCPITFFVLFYDCAQFYVVRFVLHFLTSFTLFAMFYVLDPILRFLSCFAFLWHGLRCCPILRFCPVFHFFVFFLHLSSYFTSLLSYCRVFDSTHKQGITLFASS